MQCLRRNDDGLLDEDSKLRGGRVEVLDAAPSKQFDDRVSDSASSLYSKVTYDIEVDPTFLACASSVASVSCFSGVVELSTIQVV